MMMKLLVCKDTESSELTCMIHCRQIIRSLQISPLKTLVHAASTISATIQFTFLPHLLTLNAPSKQSFLLLNTRQSRKRYRTRIAIPKQHTSYHGTVIWNIFKPGHKLFFFYFRALNKSHSTFTATCIAGH
jgi:hypothetical protein